MTRHFRTFLLFAVLFAAWLLMSGHYTPLLITLGVVSCAGAALLADRIGGTDEEGLPLHVMARLPAYLAWLVKEIIMSNIATGRLILFGRARPVLFSTPATQLAACAVALVLALVRAMRGPTAFDRLLAVNAIGTTVILGIALHGYVLGRPEFVDISILYAIINFIGTFAVLKLFDTGGLGDSGGRAKPDLPSGEEGQ